MADDVSVVELDSVRARVATTPLAMVLAFIPDTTQLETPAVLLQVIDFPAAVAAAPAATTRLPKSLVKYVIVHWTADGWVPVELKDKFKLTTVPGAPEPDDRTREL